MSGIVDGSSPLLNTEENLSFRMLAFVALSEWVMPVFALRGATPWLSIFVLFINP